MMPLTTKFLASYYREAYEHNASKQTLTALHHLVVQSLSPQEHEVYRLIRDHAPVTSTDVCEAISCTQNHAGYILKKLTDYGLVHRVSVTDDVGTRFEYMTRSAA